MCCARRRVTGCAGVRRRVESDLYLFHEIANYFLYLRLIPLPNNAAEVKILLKIGNSGLVLPFVFVKTASVVVGGGKVRLQANGFVIVAQRVVDLALLLMHIAPTVIRLGKVRLQADRFVDVTQRALQVALVRARSAAIVVGVGSIVRLQANGFVIIAQRAIEVTLVLARKAAVVIGGGIVSVEE
jgi:hypothetical protein